MLLEKIRKFWEAGLAETNKILSLFVSISIVSLMIAGCGDELPEVSEIRKIVVEHEMYPLSEDNFNNAESIAAVYHDIYDEAVETNTLGSLETLRRETTYISYTRIKEWRFTDKGYFCYELCVPEYPEVTEIVDGSCMVRVKPVTEENREFFLVRDDQIL